MTAATINTAELIGRALDWAAAKAEGFDAIRYEAERRKQLHRRDDAQPRAYSPSADWAQGGPIIEREKIILDLDGNEGWIALKFNDENCVAEEAGPTPLIAAMRCYVASKLGPTVQVPSELRP
jgi:hypothetical protein